MIAVHPIVEGKSKNKLAIKLLQLDGFFVHEIFSFVALLIRQKIPPKAKLHPAKAKVPARKVSEYHR
jgi:hypothetical protein